LELELLKVAIFFFDPSYGVFFTFFPFQSLASPCETDLPFRLLFPFVDLQIIPCMIEILLSSREQFD
jgi:hypothetical protein